MICKILKLFLVMSFIFSFPFQAVQAEEMEFEVHGMACSFCAYGLEKKVKKLEGVESFSVDVTTGKATLKTKEGVSINQDELEKAVRKSGLKMKNNRIISSKDHGNHKHDNDHHDHSDHEM